MSTRRDPAVTAAWRCDAAGLTEVDAPSGPLSALPGGAGAVYTALRALEGHRVAGLDDHLARLDHSARRLGWSVDLGWARAALACALRRAPRVDQAVVLEATPAAAYAVVWPWTDRRPPAGAAFARSVGARRDTPTAKASRWRVRRAAHLVDPSSDDHLLEADGALLEGFTSALLFLAPGEAWLPAGPALPSLTLQRLRPLLAATGRRVVDRRVTWADLPAVTEVGMASALRGLWPVGRLGEHAVPLGPEIPALSIAFEADLRADARPVSAAVGPRPAGPPAR